MNTRKQKVVSTDNNTLRYSTHIQKKYKNETDLLCEKRTKTLVFFATFQKNKESLKQNKNETKLQPFCTPTQKPMFSGTEHITKLFTNNQTKGEQANRIQDTMAEKSKKRIWFYNICCRLSFVLGSTTTIHSFCVFIIVNFGEKSTSKQPQMIIANTIIITLKKIYKSKREKKLKHQKHNVQNIQIAATKRKTKRERKQRAEQRANEHAKIVQQFLAFGLVLILILIRRSRVFSIAAFTARRLLVVFSVML